QADLARIDVNRRLFDQRRYERMMTASPEEVRLADMRSAYNRARNEPPATDIWSGTPLNDLYVHIADHLSKAGWRGGAAVTLDEDMRKRINFSSGVGGNVGLLKDDGKLVWPLPLQAADFQSDRKQLEMQLGDVVRQLKFGNALAPATLRDMQTDLQR